MRTANVPATMDRDQFRRNVDRIADSRDAQAKALGIKRRTLQKYLEGSLTLPDTVAKLSDFLASR